MSPHDPTGTIGSLPERLADRFERLRHRLPQIDADRPSRLMELRGELETLRDESEEHQRHDLAGALRRLVLMTEVWECLAAECPESARAAGLFCIRALENVASAAGNDGDGKGLSWIIQESSACWSDYLALIDSGSAQQLADGGDQVFEPDPEIGSDAPLPVIDATTLFQMLTGSPVPAQSSGAGPTAPQPSTKALERGAPPKADETAEPCRSIFPFRGEEAGKTLHRAASTPGPVTGTRESSAPASPAPGATGVEEIDPEFREAFLSEALDLFERVESLVLTLTRGTGHEDALNELGRCLHTLKGAAGSVGLIELASRVHFLEQALEDALGQVTSELLDQLHQALGYLEAVLASFRQGSVPGPQADLSAEHGPVSTVSPDRLEPLREGPLGSKLGGDDEKPTGDEPLASAEPADGPIRIPSSRMDELMDLASELIARRGVWAAQAERLKQFAAMIRACRNDLQVRLDGLNELGLGRMAHTETGRQTALAGRDHAGRGRADADGIATVILRLTEQVEDLSVLAEAAQAQALPLADDSDTLARLTLQLWETLQSIRIIPIRGLFQRLARVAHDAARIEGREVEVVMVGEETGLDRAVQDKAFEPLLHVVRNAVGHGIEAPAERRNAGKSAVGRVTLEARREGNTLVLSVRDDGRGLDYAAIAEKGRRLGLLGTDETAGPDQLGALIFRSGFSTRDAANAISGRGVGMDVVAQEVRRLRGTIELTSQPGAGTRLTVRLPARLALEQAMIVRVAGQAFAIPITLIEHAQAFVPGDVEGTGSAATVRVRNRRVPLIVAREALGFSVTAPSSCPKLLLVRAEGKELALLFDAIEGTSELVIKAFGPLLAGHPVIWGTSQSLTGDVIFIINPSGLFHWLSGGRAAAVPANDPVQRPAPVLVVDDSISVRRVATRQLRTLGLEVEEVSNGVEALGKLSTRQYSMVLTDLEMPRMDGFELLAEMQRSPVLAALPVIVASTESRPTTRRRAIALGARAFLAKPIDQGELARVASALLSCAIGNAQPQ